MRSQPSARHNSYSQVIANHRIRYTEVRVLDDHGEALGIMSTKDALLMAQEAGKDLVLVTEQAKPPVTKIIELTKYKYQEQQKAAANRKNARRQDIKEVRFTPFMGQSDFEQRLKKVEAFLIKGDKVRLSLMFKGRAITKKEFGYEMFGKVIAATAEYAKVELEPKLLGKKLMAQLIPAGKKTNEKAETKNS